MKKLLVIVGIFVIIQASAQDIYTMPQGAHFYVASPENPNGLKANGGKNNNRAKGKAFISLKADQSTDLLNIQSAGIIQRIWITIDDRNPEMLRGLKLRIYWDKSKTPAVDVPFGDFFCAGIKPVAFQSALFANPEGRSFIATIQMPFKTGARITLTNESGKDLAMLFYDVDFVKIDKPQSNALYFHVSFNHHSKPVGQDIELMPRITGKGRFLGISASVTTNPAYKNTWWGEGEVKMYIEGDQNHPTINGTGAEDYLSTGWMLGAFSNQYQGCLVADAAKGEYSFYRFHIPDAIYFYHDFRATIQQIGGWFAPDVKKLIAAGVPLKPVSLSGDKGLSGLMEKGANVQAELDKADAQDWLNFYCSDDYPVTAYYYLDKP